MNFIVIMNERKEDFVYSKFFVKSWAALELGFYFCEVCELGFYCGFLPKSNLSQTKVPISPASQKISHTL